MFPQPLSVPCALPTPAFKLWPLQEAPVLDIVLQPFRFAFDAPLAEIPVLPLPASARMQYEYPVVPVATAPAVSVDIFWLFAVALLWYPTTCEKNNGT